MIVTKNIVYLEMLLKNNTSDFKGGTYLFIFINYKKLS